MSRVFSTRKNQITQAYKKGVHDGIDLVGYSYALDYIVAHSAGTVVEARNNYKTNDTTGSSYGNYVKIKHDNGMYTLYAHLKYMSVPVVKGEKVQKGQIIGYMGNTGHSFGAHLHFEVRDTKDVRIDPTPYIDADLPSTEPTYPTGNYKTLYDMKVRDGVWGRVKKVSELTADGKRNATSTNQYAYAVYKEGTIFTALEIIKHTDGSVWGRSPSGYICIKETNMTYCSKL